MIASPATLNLANLHTLNLYADDKNVVTQAECVENGISAQTMRVFIRMPALRVLQVEHVFRGRRWESDSRNLPDNYFMDSNKDEELLSIENFSWIGYDVLLGPLIPVIRSLRQPKRLSCSRRHSTIVEGEDFFQALQVHHTTLVELVMDDPIKIGYNNIAFVSRYFNDAPTIDIHEISGVTDLGLRVVYHEEDEDYPIRNVLPPQLEILKIHYGLVGTREELVRDTRKLENGLRSLLEGPSRCHSNFKKIIYMDTTRRRLPKRLYYETSCIA